MISLRREAEARELALALAAILADNGQASENCPIDAEGVKLVVIESFADRFQPLIAAFAKAQRREEVEALRAKACELDDWYDLLKWLDQRKEELE